MELSGDLSDFALTDILQILALSRKTGTLIMEAAGLTGKVLIEEGRLTHASLRPGFTLADRLVCEQRLTEEALAGLRELGSQNGKIWTLESLLLESGVIRRLELEEVARRHIRDVVSVLVGIEKGRFGISLNQASFTEAMDEVRLAGGLDVGEVLLGAAKEKDEQKQETGRARASDNDRNLVLGVERKQKGLYWMEAGREGGRQAGSSELGQLGMVLEGGGSNGGADQPGVYGSRLCSLLAELRSHSFEAEVSLLIMRFASEVATRGILFGVKGGEVVGLGQFGLEGCENRKCADERVREIKMPLDMEDSVFGYVMRARQPYVGPLDDVYWHNELVNRIGGDLTELSVFVLPLVCNGNPVFIFYGDNYPGRGELKGIDELVTLVSQAGVVFEKMELEQRLCLLGEGVT